MKARSAHPVTPDGRYFVVRGRLWRCSDPSLPDVRRQVLVNELMAARRAVRTAPPSGGSELSDARARVDAAKRGLGERGPVWWDDGAPDLNRRMAATTPYAGWFATLRRQAVSEPGDGDSWRQAVDGRARRSARDD